MSTALSYRTRRRVPFAGRCEERSDPRHDASTGSDQILDMLIFEGSFAGRCHARSGRECPIATSVHALLLPLIAAGVARSGQR
jgi:hypothetical protein